MLLAFGVGSGVVQNRESPDLRSPEVGRYVVVDSVLCDFLILEQYMMRKIKKK